MSQQEPPLTANTGKGLTFSHFAAIALGGAACASLFFLDKISPNPVAGSIPKPPTATQPASTKPTHHDKTADSSAKQTTPDQATTPLPALSD